MTGMASWVTTGDDIRRLVSVLEAAIAAAGERAQADAAMLASLQGLLDQANNRADKAEASADTILEAFSRASSDIQAQLEQARTDVQAADRRADQAEARANVIRTALEQVCTEAEARLEQIQQLRADVQATDQRADRAEAGRTAERSRADALADQVHVLQARGEASEHARASAEQARAEASVSLLALSEQLQAFEAEAPGRRSRGFLARCLAAVKGE